MSQTQTTDIYIGFGTIVMSLLILAVGAVLIGAGVLGLLYGFVIPIIKAVA